MKTFPVFNPATGDKIADVADSTRDDARRAIAAATAAFPAWSALPAADRGDRLVRLRDLMLARLEDFARLLTREQGKPLAESRAEVRYAADFVGWYAEEGKRVYGETVPAAASNKRILVLRQPLGVVAAITPWNFPVAMVTRKAAPALAAGCTVVLKPAEQTPLCAIRLAELAREAGCSDGVLNVVTPSHPEEAAREFFENPAVRKIAFTGSTEVGRILMRGAAEQIKRVTLELGGNAPLIVFEDAEVEDAVSKAVTSKFRNAGQTCICANRIFVHRRLYERFAERLTQVVRAMKVGPGDDESAEIGPLIDAAQLARVEAHVRDAVSRGAVLACGGRRVDRPGAFFEPTVLTQVTDAMAVAREETFGPVAPLLAFDTEEEVVRRANETPYGLAAYFFTNDLRRATRVMEALDYGMVGVNDVRISTAQAPFGGRKQSGFGREGGRWGIEEYLDVKYVSMEV